MYSTPTKVRKRRGKLQCEEFRLGIMNYILVENELQERQFRPRRGVEEL